jgi:hypothetical protein
MSPVIALTFPFNFSKSKEAMEVLDAVLTTACIRKKVTKDSSMNEVVLNYQEPQEAVEAVVEVIDWAERKRLKSLYGAKAKDRVICQEFLDYRSSDKYGKQKWIWFCEQLLAEGYTAVLYEAKSTPSKYITISNGDSRTYRVRISNHKANTYKEATGDCDFFVGKTMDGLFHSTEEALQEVKAFFSQT